MLFSNGIKLFVQAAYFIIIARALGVEEYGAFIAVTALGKVVAPFASWGSGDILIKHTSRNRVVFAGFWGNCIAIILVCGSIILALLLLISNFIFPTSLSRFSILLLLASEIFFTLLIDVSAKAFLAINQISRTALINILDSLKNLVAALLLISLFDDATLILWAPLYFSATLTLAVVCALFVTREIARPTLSLSKIKSEVVQGFYFSVSLSAETINHNIDKTMLAKLSTLEAAGIYAAAYRLIDVTFIPVRSLMAAAYTRFFQKGVGGIRATLRFALNLSAISGLYGALSGLALFIAAPLVPIILGDDYITSVDALRWLCPLPFLLAFQFFAADTLTGTGFQGTRSAIQVIAAIVNVVANAWLIPLYSWTGAAWSSLASEAFKAIFLWLLLLLLYRREHKARKR